MIFIGFDDDTKRAEIQRYLSAHDIDKLIVISSDEFPLLVDGADQVKYSDVIMYVTFYRLLQEIDTRTLIVVNECLRTQNRYDLSYNCIRNYLNLTRHQLIFQLLPQIDTREDFMILFDLDTQSRWKRRPFDPYLISQETSVQINPLPLAFERIDVPTSDRTRSRYEAERARLFAELGNRDPHTLPRNLYQIGGQDKLAYISAHDMPMFAPTADKYIARNQRLAHPDIVSYADAQPEQVYTIIEFPHRFIDFCDFIRTTSQVFSRVLVADLKEDNWYFSRYTDWSRRIDDTYASLQ